MMKCFIDNETFFLIYYRDLDRELHYNFDFLITCF